MRDNAAPGRNVDCALPSDDAFFDDDAIVAVAAVVVARRSGIDCHRIALAQHYPRLSSQAGPRRQGGGIRCHCRLATAHPLAELGIAHGMAQRCCRFMLSLAA